RALRSGAETIAALHLRSGDALGALADLDRTSAQKVRPNSLYERLDRAANGGDAAAWRDLLEWLWNPDRKDTPMPGAGDSDPEFAIDPSLLRAALFGTAIETYRLDPTAPDVAGALARLLVQLGLPEAAPLVLADAAVARPNAPLLSRSLALVLETIRNEDASDDIATARRVYAAAEPLLSLAARAEWRGKIEPSAARLRLEARKRANNPVTKGHSERLLARVLFRFSDTAGAARATERAFVAAGQDKREIAATVLDAAQRAFLKKDVAAARAAVNRGLSG